MNEVCTVTGRPLPEAKPPPVFPHSDKGNRKRSIHSHTEAELGQGAEAAEARHRRRQSQPSKKIQPLHALPLEDDPIQNFSDADELHQEVSLCQEPVSSSAHTPSGGLDVNPQPHTHAVPMAADTLLDESEDSGSGSGNSTLSSVATLCYGNALNSSGYSLIRGQASAEADASLPSMTSEVSAALRDQAILVHSQSEDEDNMPLLHLVNVADRIAPSCLLMLVILTCMPHSWLVWWPLQTSMVTVIVTHRHWRRSTKSLRRLFIGRVVCLISPAPNYRPVHHFAGVRVGEAKNPGPGSLRQAALSFIPGQPSHAMTHVPRDNMVSTSGATDDASSQAPTSHDREMATVRDDVLDSTNDAPVGDSIPYPAEAGESGSHDRGTKRCAKTGHATRGEVLRAWLDDYRPMLAPTSVQEVTDFIKLIEGEATPPMVCPPPPAVIEHQEESVCEDVPLWRAPTDTDLARINITIDQLMAPVMQTQKVLPASVLHVVSASLIWLIKLHEDLTQSSLVRQWSLRILVLAPRLLWPAPAKPAGGARLPPFARPHLIKHRLYLLHSGQWHSLLETVLDVPLWRPAKDVATNPGTVTPAAAKRIAAAAKEGKIGTAWKQLWSYGVATPNDHAAEAVEKKWAPPSAESCITC
eukprot:4739245-Amphidinium_carterae.5